MRQLREAIRCRYVEGRTTSEIITGHPRHQGAAVRGRYPQPRLPRAGDHRRPRFTPQTARQAYADANADLVTAVRWVSTLDSRTSPPCRIRDGSEYTADAKHRPIGHKIRVGDGPGQSALQLPVGVRAGVPKSWRELGIDADELPAATRASMDGQVPGRHDRLRNGWSRQSTLFGRMKPRATCGALKHRKGGSLDGSTTTGASSVAGATGGPPALTRALCGMFVAWRTVPSCRTRRNPDAPADKVRAPRGKSVRDWPACSHCGGREVVAAKIGNVSNKLCVARLMQGRRVVVDSRRPGSE